MTDRELTSVLIIDSDNVHRGMLACTLPAQRYRLEFANSAETGLNLLAGMAPQVVILGCSGPGDLCQRVRALPAGHACTVLLMDERFRDEAVGQAEVEQAGADAFLPFPFELELLESALLLTQRRKGPLPPPAATNAGLSTLADAVRPPASSAPAPASEEQEWRRFEARVAEIHRQLDTVSYYDLLQVAPSAGGGVIKQAYFDRSIEFHPDRFMRLPDELLRAQIYDIFKRMSEAFKVLSNPEARTSYDANLTSPDRQIRYLERERGVTPDDPAEDAATPAGKKYLAYALLAEDEGKLRSARMYLSMALQYEPENEALHARLERLTRRLVV